MTLRHIASSSAPTGNDGAHNYDGICLESQTDVNVINNTIWDSSRYHINVANAGCTRVRVFGNRYGADVYITNTGDYNDAGTGTITS